MVHAIRVREYGGPQVMKWETIDVPVPGPDQALIRQTAIGLNFLDTYHRSGHYPEPLPFSPGNEGAGIVEAIGPGVTTVKPGDRVAYAGVIGAYAETRVIPAAKLVVIPNGVTDQQAAAMMLKGMTAEYLVRRTYRVKPGDTILIHAAAGGVGLIVCQWAKHLGATVIGTVGTDEKAALAKAHGCDHPIVTAREDFIARVAEITDGKKLPVVYDSIGKDTFMKSLDCLAPFGLLAAFGQSSGGVEPLNIGVLAAKGSLYVTRPTLGTYIATPALLAETARDLFDVVGKGIVKIAINQTYPLKDAVQAHIDLESRKTTGSTIFTV
ncbi:MAG TPA: quinone oxidoreductase [Stellaceae bacterium]|nr:quinone oxidoreductase [Stellaceae bacterium]